MRLPHVVLVIRGLPRIIILKVNYFGSLKMKIGGISQDLVCHTVKKNNESTLLNEPKTKAIKMDDEFFYTVEAPLVKPRTNERFAYRVELEKKITDLKLEGVYLIIDARNKEKSKRFYKSVELFNDKFEGRNKWKKLIFEDQILDNFQEYDFVSLYFWNQSKKTFLIRNFKIVLEKYKG